MMTTTQSKMTIKADDLAVLTAQAGYFQGARDAANGDVAEYTDEILRRIEGLFEEIAERHDLP